MAIDSVLPPKVSDLHTSNARGWRQWLTHNSLYPCARLAAAACALLAVAGCASPRSLSVTQGPLQAATSQQAGFTMAVAQPAGVSAPAPCSGCIGEGYDSSVSLSVTLTSTAYSGPVGLSVSGLPSNVAFVQQPIPPVSLAYGSPQTVKLDVYVLPGAAPGDYQFTVSAGSGVTAPVVLTITSPIQAAWRR